MTVELKNVLLGRENFYGFLSRIFLEPPDKKIYEMIEQMLPSLETITENEEGRFKNSVTEIKKIMEKRQSKSGQDLKDDDLETLRKYTRLFCLTDSTPVSESYYTSVDKLVMQESRDDVVKIYRKYGFSMDSNSNEPEDHIAYELMFIAYLSSIARNALENDKNFYDNLKLQNDFLHSHLLNWCDKFVEKIESVGGLSIYVYMGRFMSDFLKNDADFLESCLE